MLLFFASGAVFGQSAPVKYIESYKDAAIRIMNENGIPASIVLGVAIHESGSGTSKIARILNNHFGFKGPNKSKEIKSAYKGYESVEASYADFVSLLKERSKFRPLFDQYSSFDYYNWVMGIQRAGYAKSTTWAAQVLAIIKKYELYQYDNHPAEDTIPVRESVNTVPPIMMTNRPATEPRASSANGNAGLIYKVKSGDTLSEIAEEFHTTVKTILQDNGLTSTRLSIGQKLKLRTGK
jgi:hypothetical protein